MPIVEIRSLPPREPAHIPAMLREAAVGGARAFGIAESRVWATFEEIRPGHYAEGGTTAEHPGEGTHPPLVLVRAIKGRTPEMIRAFVAAVCEAVGRGLGIPPTNVWVQFVEMERAQIWHNGAFYS